MNKSIIIGNDITVKRIGLGTNRIKDDRQSQDALRHAIKIGINFIDTASAYTSGVSEAVIGKTLSPYAPDVIIVTKGGMHPPDFRVDSRPEALQHQLEQSLEKLHLDQIPLYFLHRIDAKVPLKESVLSLKKKQDEKKIKHIGLSEVTIEQIKEAQAYAEIAAVQNEYNLLERKYDAVVDYCESNGIVFIPWFPLGRGNLESIQHLLDPLAQKYTVTPIQIALAWLLRRSPVMLPIPGSLSLGHLEENFKSLEVALSNEDFNTLSHSVNE